MEHENKKTGSEPDVAKLLELLGAKKRPAAEEFKKLILHLDSHQVLAKVFLLEGTPFVFDPSPMKYVIFKEQLAERFDVGSQDICIVGSAMLGFSPSPHKYGESFSKTSDVDVVIISEELFHKGSHELFALLNQLRPTVYEIQPFLNGAKADKNAPPVKLDDWRKVKEVIRNFVYENFNPGLLPNDNTLKQEIFNKISSTAGLFLALEPRVFVSKIRGRIFRNWKAAEEYYANTLREARRALEGEEVEAESDDLEQVAAASAHVPGATS